jgi:Domain of unknown function (DUF6429)
MGLDSDKIDDAVLALLVLGRHSGWRAWKGIDWEAMNRLHERGYISDPRTRAQSVVFTEDGLARAERLLAELFGKKAEPVVAPDPRRP